MIIAEKSRKVEHCALQGSYHKSVITIFVPARISRNRTT